MSRFWRSLRYALAGVEYLLEHQPNMRIHFAATILALVIAIYFRIQAAEWIILLTVITMVVITEMLNTAIETVVDMITSEYSRAAEIAKDTAAGATLVAAVLA